MLPRAVREQAERAEAAHQAFLNGNTAQATPAQQPVVPPVEAAPVVESTPAEPVVAPQVVAEAAPVSSVADSWELKYRVLEGKYRAEVPRQAARIRELESQLAGKGEGELVPSSATTGEARKRVVEQYGDDFATAVDSIAQERTADLKRQVEELGAGTAERARSDFMRDLTGLVPKWQVIDRDAAFTAFLDEFDPLTGRTRREFFNEADQTNNAARVASFFVAFAKGNKPLAPVPAAVEPTSVEHLISPESSNHAEPAPTKKQWTRKEAAKFYADARAQGANRPYGKYTAAQYQQINADIDAAIAEGRLVG